MGNETNEAATPFFLHEALLTLYLADATGDKLTSANPVWMGALANNLSFDMELDQRKFFSSGDEFLSTQQMDEEHIIEIERTWFVRKATGKAFELRRNQKYVLEIVWYEPRFRTWHRRIYYGVTSGRLGRRSAGPLHFIERQRFEATSYAAEGGDGDPNTASPPTGSGGVQTIIFPYEAVLLVDSYMSGVYEYPTVARGVRATFHGKAPQASAVEVTLELDGVLTEFKLTLPTGAAGEDVDDEVDLTDLEIPPGTLIRWKVTQAPDPETSAYLTSVEMTLSVEEES